MRVEIVHQRDPDSTCGFAVYIDGQRVPDADAVAVYSVDAGYGYDFVDWAHSAYLDKRSASPAVWVGMLAECYADPCGAEYVDNLPAEPDWVAHLDDTEADRQWWRDNLPAITPPFQCDSVNSGTRCVLPYGHGGSHRDTVDPAKPLRFWT